MRLQFSIPQGNLVQLLRRAGYAPEGADEKTGEFRFVRPLRGRRYPRFHLYCREGGTCNLHLDQKQPSYQGSSAHGGEYNGPLVEQEVLRLSTLQI